VSKNPTSKTSGFAGEPPLLQDPQARNKTIDDLGWANGSAEDFSEQRAYLQQHNGIKGLERLQPTDIDDAVRIFYRDGFVVIENALDSEQLAELNEASARVIRDILAKDKNRQGNRGSHRYSFGSASLTGQLLHEPAWAMLADLSTVTPIITAIFGSPDYILRGAGGDFCLPGASAYQPLHSDMNDRLEYAGQTFGSFHDPRGRLNYRDLPCPYVCCNFLTCDFTATNGPTRQIPGTQHSQQKIPKLADEPEWMKLSTVCPAPAGSVLIRDTRAWHGGTPNLSDHVRAMPNAEFHAPWYREPMRASMPRHIYETLSEHGQYIARYIVAQPGEELATGFRDDLGTTPPGLRDRPQKPT
jgi:ectoine hydroxylase-related dioxygenase (phytanoyl-CoA dioxygenase family)